jgi:nucleoid-associated protein YgaU
MGGFLGFSQIKKSMAKGEQAMERNKIILVLTLFAAGALLYGCGGTKRVESTEVPKQPQANEPVVQVAEPTPTEQVAAATPTPSITVESYQVVKHDTLWDIAGKSGIYNDSFQWPLIFKANRDTIQDPDLIYPKQDFKIEKGLSPEEVNRARKLASDTPKYVPHTQPRQALPLDYF